MAKKKQQSDIKRTKRAFGAKLKWVANNLSEEKLDHVDQLAPSSEQLMDFFLEALDVGLDIKVGWDDYSSCYQATAIGAWDGFPSAGYAVSARSSRDAYDALILMYYKVFVMAEMNLSNLYTDKESEDFRG